MRMRLGQLRSLLAEALLGETVDLPRMAQRAMHGRAIVTTTDGNDDAVIVIDPSNGSVVAAVLASIGTHTVSALFSEHPVDTALVLVAALRIFGSMRSMGMVSPAAKAVIKRYYDSCAGDPRLVRHDRVKRPQTFMSATYLDPGAPDLGPALRRGEEFIARLASARGIKAGIVKKEIFDAAIDGFEIAHNDNKRTGYGRRNENVGGFPGQPAARNVLSPDVNDREQLGAISAKGLDTVDDPDGLPDHLTEPVIDPDECLGPVPPDAEPPYVGQDPFARQTGPQPFSGGGRTMRG